MKKKVLSFILAASLLVGAVCALGHGVFIKAGAVSAGDSILFGSYPQGLVKDKSLVSKLDKCSKKWKSYGYYSGAGEKWYQAMAGWRDTASASDYMRFADFFCEGVKYRAVTFDAYRPSYTADTHSAEDTFQDENGYKTGRTYYFKYEPVAWTVLDPSSGLVVCDNILDSQPFDDSFESGDENSIRAWLDDEFYNTAFSDEQKSVIKVSSVDATLYLTDPDEAPDVYRASVFFLSYYEAQDCRYLMPHVGNTDYARCQGLAGLSWHLIHGGGVRVMDDGEPFYYDGFMGQSIQIQFYSHDSGMGVRPAMRLKALRSDDSVSAYLYSAGTYSADPASGGEPGYVGSYDVDGDGDTTAQDARLTLRFAIGLEDESGGAFWLSDTDSDGYVTAQDARTILRAALGMDSEVPDAKPGYDVEDAVSFDNGEVSYHVPKLTSSDGRFDDLNRRILTDVYNNLLKEDIDNINSGLGSWVWSCDYTVAQKDDIVSVCVNILYFANDLQDFKIYNVDFSTGENVPDSDVVGAFGMDMNAFFELCRTALDEDHVRPLKDFLGDDPYLLSALGAENVNLSVPFIGEDGKLCAVVRSVWPDPNYHVAVIDT